MPCPEITPSPILKIPYLCANIIMKRIFIFLVFSLLTASVLPQSAFEHLTNQSVYQLIDELSALHYIDANTAIKPYSRKQIADWLVQASAHEKNMPPALRKRIQLQLQEYALENGVLPEGKLPLIRHPKTLAMHLLPPELAYKDSLFSISLRPIYGIKYVSNENGSFYHSYGGASMTAYAGKGWAAYASIRDNYQTLEPLAQPSFLTTEPGGNYKIGVQGRSGAEYSEMRGGITYSWKWGSFGLIKDHIRWGDSYNGSNIFSGRSPSFPMVKLQLKPASWLEFNYYHGWLISQVIDSSRSYYTSNGDFRGVFRQKYIAANMYTFKPFKQLHLSVGNSIVYSDVPVQPAYLIPFFFFKSLDHTLNKDIDNQNSAMFLNISSRQIKRLHMFGSIFFDELSFSRLSDPNRHNFWSLKAGAALSGWPVSGLSLSGEYTRTTPLTYKHRVPATTFASNQFNLGHYMQDNSEEIFVSASWFPLSQLQLKLSYTNAWHGNDYQYVFGDTPVDENPVLKEKSWSSKSIAMNVEYLPVANIRIFGGLTQSMVEGYAVDGQTAQYYLDRFGPKYLHGNTITFSVGFGIGL